MVDHAFEIYRSFRPPAPQPSSDSLPPLQLLKAVFFNPLNLWLREHFEKPVVVARTLLGTRLVVSDPALIKWILVDNADNYVRDSLQQRVLYRMTGRGVFSAEGADWHFQRKTLAPLFSAKSVASYFPGMTAVAENAVERFSSSGNQDIDLGREMAALTVDVLGRTIFTNGLGESPAAIAGSVRQFADTNGPVELGDLLGLPAWVPGVRRIFGWRATRLVQQRARRIFTNAKALDQSQKNDFISALLSAHNPETGKMLGNREIEDNISTLIGAGSDTVAVTLTWAIFLLSQSPYVREAIESEVDTYLKTGLLTVDTLRKLVWTRAVVEETMRLYPPAPLIGRMARNEEMLGGERVSAGASILISPWVLHRHARLWSDPDMFDPERFLPGRRDQISRYSYLPFGAGPRVCMGMNFAMQEAVILLAMLIKYLRFERADNHPIRLRQCITLQTDAPLRMRISPRQT